VQNEVSISNPQTEHIFLSTSGAHTDNGGAAGNRKVLSLRLPLRGVMAFNDATSSPEGI